MISPALTAPDPKGKKLQEYATFLEAWKVANSSNFEELQVARSTIKKLNKVILSEYKKWKEQRRKAAATLLETAESNSETASAAALSPLERDNQRKKRALQTQPKTPSVDGGKHVEDRFDARDYVFKQIAQMQRAYPKTTFAQPPIDPNAKAHQHLVTLILQALQRDDQDHLVGYAIYVAAKFKGIAPGGQRVKPRAPGDPRGPEGLGLLERWAWDYARIELGQGAGGGGQ